LGPTDALLCVGMKVGGRGQEIERWRVSRTRVGRRETSIKREEARGKREREVESKQSKRKARVP
jgi:hypothetical protein